MHKGKLNLYNLFVILLKAIAIFIFVITRENFQMRELFILLLFLLNEIRKYYKYHKKIENKSNMEMNINNSEDYPNSDNYFSKHLENDYFIRCKGTPYFKKGYRYAIKQKPKKAMDMLMKAAELADNLKDKSITYFLIGYCYEQLDDTNNALATYEKSVNIDSNNLFAWKFMGICYSQNGNPEKAISCYKNILAIKPNDVATLASLGGAYIRLEDYHLAIKVLEDALYYLPNFICSLTNICMAYAGIGDKDNVDKYIKQLVDLDSPEFDSDRYNALKERVDYLLEQSI